MSDAIFTCPDLTVRWWGLGSVVASSSRITGSKKGLRLILAIHTLDQARTAKARLQGWVTAADTEETDRLWATLNTWWPAVEVFITSRVTNARTEAVNTTIKHIKRTGRGYRNNEHYQARMLLHSAQRARQHC